MPRWLARALTRIRELAATGAVRLTYKAQREALLVGLSPEDVRELVAGLTARDSAGRIASGATGEWLYVFELDVGGQPIYLKVLVREDCVVVSCHEDADEEDG